MPNHENLNLWHLKESLDENENQRTVIGLNVLKLHSEHNIKGKNAKVAIVDSGIDPTHPNLREAVSPMSRSFEAYFVSAAGAAPFADQNSHMSSANAAPSEYPKEVFNRYNAHGTALAGIVAGRPPTQKIKEKLELEAKGAGNPAPTFTSAHEEFTGVAPEASLIIIRLYANFQIEQFEAALQYVGEHADVVLFARPLPEETRNAVEALARKKPVVCAAGNGGFDDLAFPASARSTIAVGACNIHGERSRYSQYGEGLDVVAPSNDALPEERDDKETPDKTEWGIATTDNVGRFGYSRSKAKYPDFVTHDDESVFGGTSAAAAQIAGVVALMIGEKKSLANQPSEVRDLLRKGGSLYNPKNPNEQPDHKLGWGLVDAEKVVLPVQNRRKKPGLSPQSNGKGGQVAQQAVNTAQEKGKGGTKAA